MNMENKYLLILFYSAGGSTRKIAHAIADGAEEENLNVKIRTVPKVSSLSEKTQDDVPEKVKFTLYFNFLSLIWKIMMKLTLS